jgi:hypothetical protein
MFVHNLIRCILVVSAMLCLACKHDSDAAKNASPEHFSSLMKLHDGLAQFSLKYKEQALARKQAEEKSATDYFALTKGATYREASIDDPHGMSELINLQGRYVQDSVGEKNLAQRRPVVAKTLETIDFLFSWEKIQMEEAQTKYDQAVRYADETQALLDTLTRRLYEGK